MKAKIKKIVWPIFLSVLCGFICGKLVYNIYEDKTDISFNDNIIYLLQSGAYKNYDSMRTSTIGYDYVYYEEEGMYKAIIGITKSKENIDIIKNLYGEEVIVSEYYLNDNEINNKIIEYDKLLTTSNEEKESMEIIAKMLSIYKEEEIKLTKIS